MQSCLLPAHARPDQARQPSDDGTQERLKRNTERESDFTNLNSFDLPQHGDNVFSRGARRRPVVESHHRPLDLKNTSLRKRKKQTKQTIAPPLSAQRREQTIRAARRSRSAARPRQHSAHSHRCQEQANQNPTDESNVLLSHLPAMMLTRPIARLTMAWICSAPPSAVVAPPEV